ncbi:isochorismate synthase MenF [Afifella sp. IM 167]|uniref:isochorismate synthase n=1 Tax=Afifella sp. IM 167 TaxID=2033586 RepID=UPI001CCE9B77|nr:isochorismate synthase [Afifella sp. IM 167]
MNADLRSLPGLLERAIAAASEKLAGVPRGSVASLCVALPADALASAPRPRGAYRWIAPARELALYAAGEALRGDREQLDDLCGPRSAWRIIGNARQAVPLAFFTLPPATERQSTSFVVPSVLFRREGGEAGAVLTARFDGQALSDIAREWLELAAAMLSGAPANAAASFESRLAEPEMDIWRERVERTTAAIRAGRFDKAVLARRLELSLAEAVDPLVLADRLAEAHAGSNIFSFPYRGGFVVAASPERLAAKADRRMASDALAGTTRHAGIAPEDEAADAALVASAKERREHRIVVDAIAAALGDLCDSVERPEAPELMHLARVTHLWTPLAGQLKPEVGLLDVVERLHPTPAVSGFPRQAALDWLKALGEARDGLYSGVAGWIDRKGDGEAAVVLRGAYLDGRQASLWAGAGIMAESDPDAEWAETEMKLATMLDFLEAK